MNILAIRGATTIKNNISDEILQATEELLANIIEQNNIGISEIVSITFTATKDITKIYPAVAARRLGITQAALMCMQEMYVEGSLPMCIRVMVQIQRQANHSNSQVQHVYLREAQKLRPDLVKKQFSIAIDGPAGAGKSTIAKEISKALGYIYIDTGAMYRAVAYYCEQKGIDWNDEQSVISLMDDIDIKIKNKDNIQYIYVNDTDITECIRTQQIAAGASAVATYEIVRKKLVELQRALASQTSVVMDGRDIGTHVLPQATIKIFLTASVSERALRRMKELTGKGIAVELEEIKQEIIARDANDSNRKISPLRKAVDAIEIDTTGKSIDTVVKEILQLIDEHRKGE